MLFLANLVVWIIVHFKIYISVVQILFKVNWNLINWRLMFVKESYIWFDCHSYIFWFHEVFPWGIEFFGTIVTFSSNLQALTMSLTYCFKKSAKASGCSFSRTMIEFKVNDSGREFIFKSLALFTALQRVLELPGIIPLLTFLVFSLRIISFISFFKSLSSKCWEKFN